SDPNAKPIAETRPLAILACGARFPENRAFGITPRVRKCRLIRVRAVEGALTQVHSLKRIVGYFSMEIALENAMPSYSGGLGVLAGDTVRAAADIRLPMLAVSLLYRKGYFTQL